MSGRRRMPNRRSSLTLAVECHGLRFTLTASRFSDGSIGDFVTNHKASSAAGIMASDSAIAASFALQFGCAPKTLSKALCCDGSGRASGAPGVALDILDDLRRT
jgi:hypothetical protein